jgi:hypothetical protein
MSSVGDVVTEGSQWWGGTNVGGEAQCGVSGGAEKWNKMWNEVWWGAAV